MEIQQNVIEDILRRETPTIVGVSGFGGAGKSTYASALGVQIDAPVIGVDSFFKSNTQEGSSMWDSIDFDRLNKEVIESFLAGKEEITYGQFDWVRNQVGEQVSVRHSGRIIIEGVGLFRTGIEENLDYKIWIHCSPAQSTERGKQRDVALGANHDALWDGIWRQNDQEYLEHFSPIDRADVVIDNSDPTFT